jgi:hypothetical protein
LLDLGLADESFCHPPAVHREKPSVFVVRPPWNDWAGGASIRDLVLYPACQNHLECKKFPQA